MKLKLITTKELHTKKPAELAKYLTELKTTLNDLQYQIHTNKDKQTHQLKILKRSIARVKTIETSLKGKEK